MTRTNKPVTVTLGAYREKLEARVASGRYASASEVVRAGLDALDREETEFDAWARSRIEAWEQGPKTTYSSDEVFDRIFARHEALTRAADEEV